MFIMKTISGAGFSLIYQLWYFLAVQLWAVYPKSKFDPSVKLPSWWDLSYCVLMRNNWDNIKFSALLCQK